MNPEVVLPMVLGIGLAYGVLPAMAVRAGEASKPRRVTCPDNEQSATVHLDMVEEVRSLFFNGTPCIGACSRWPEKGGCDRACQGQIA